MFEVICRMVAHHHFCGLDRDEFEGYFADDAGEAHAPDGCPEKIRILLSGAGFLAAVGQNQLDAQHVVAEAAVMMMVFAMHVRGDTAAQRHKLGTGRDRQEPALFDDHRQNIGQGHAGFGAQDALFHIQFQHAVYTFGEDYTAIFIQRGVAITAALAACNHSIGAGAQIGIALRAFQFAGV